MYCINDKGLNNLLYTRRVLRIMVLKMFAFNHGLEGDEVAGAQVQMCDI